MARQGHPCPTRRASSASGLRPLRTLGGRFSLPPRGGLKHYDLHAIAGGVAFKSF